MFPTKVDFGTGRRDFRGRRFVETMPWSSKLPEGFGSVSKHPRKYMISWWISVNDQISGVILEVREGRNGASGDVFTCLATKKRAGLNLESHHGRWIWGRPSFAKDQYPRHSMYGVFTYIYPLNYPNVGKYTLHWVSGFSKPLIFSGSGRTSWGKGQDSPKESRTPFGCSPWIHYAPKN